ncbi:uncharacterized protein LOC114247306 [Bombyx mandarina]|uniref:Hemolin n=1 Tax=Bombyx mandarina TaxID=7092 RepID=A0A6J2K1C3_BOMMA|nr:uncharacterized protein LOC114247306 [Bombyx mandarina]
MRVKRSVHVRLIALCTTCMLLQAMACPSQCICKWKNGKRYVECSEKDLKAIPDSLDSETQVLDFTGNDLQVLQKETFHKLKLIDLQKIYLQRCRLQKIDSQAFKGLANLVELDLSNNYLNLVPSSNFVFIPSLMRLSINNNPIASIKTHCFQHLSYLNTLELSDCKIETIERDAFAGLNHLEWLRLSGNKLSNIQGENLFPDTLRGINLQNNNWNCDCHLRDLHSWLLNFNMPHAVEPACSLPERLKKRTITSISENELACLPKMSPTSVYVETNAGNNVTLECLVKAIPEAKITWLYQGQIIHNYSTMSPDPRIYYVENGVTDKKSELYIMGISNEDNGTYTCAAENSAGRARANYTLRILVKEEPVVIVVTFPHRHLVVIVTVVFLIIVLLIAIIAVVMLKFKTDTRSRKKKESGKDVALCNQILPSSRSNGNIPKNNGSLIVNAHSHHALHYTVQTNRDYEPSDVYQSNNMKGFVDRNPDLISDAETVANNAQNENTALSVYKAQSVGGDGFEEETAFTAASVPRQVTWQDQQPVNNMNLPQNTLNNMYQHSADVHLNPGCFLDSEGYPYDYGLPKHPCRPPIMSNYSVVGPFYQTLPHNRPKNQKLVCKFAKDTEFNTAQPTCPNFEMYNMTTNVRRTLEGYPVPRNRQIAFVGNGTVYYNDEFVPSPPEGYKTDPMQYCATEPCPSWNPKGTCAVMVPMSVTEGPGRCYQVETRCVDTQTSASDARMPAEGIESVLKPLPQVSNVKCAGDICSESPDEGYVGDANDI